MTKMLGESAINDALPGEAEAYQALLARAHRKTGGVPPEMVVRHILSVTRGSDWPIRRDALEALIRRFTFSRADRLEIVARPPRGRLLGFYATRRRGFSARPYRTLLRGVEPFSGSCDCPDFLRSSLGLCKHLLTVLEDVISRPRALDRIRREPAPNKSPLRWDPIRPFTGPVDGKAEIRGARNLDTLRHRLAGCMIRRVRQEVLSQLPARTDTRIPIEMTAEQIEEHDALNVPIAQLVARSKRRPLSQAEFLRLMTLLTTQRIIANGLAQLRFESMWPDLSKLERPSESTLRGLSSPKLLELRELLDQIAVAQQRKVVVFSQWRRMLRLAHWATRDELLREGVRAAFFTGDEGQKRRTQNLVEFHDDPACRVLFATDAGGVGLNLQRAASACINIELPWNPAVLEQRIGRIYRLGQTRPIDVYNLVSEPGIESRISDLVGNKRALFTGLFDGTTDEVAFERSGSFLTRIERIVVSASAPAPARGVETSEAEDESSEREIDAMVAAGDESRDTPAPPPPEPERPVVVQDVQRLFSSLAVQRTARGGLVIEAPPETASTLATLFSAMAQLLQAVAVPPASPASPTDARQDRRHSKEPAQ